MESIPHNLIPKGYKIRSITTGYTTKYWVEKINPFLPLFWMTVKKPCLDIVIDSSSKADYYDEHSRGFNIVISDGECRTFEDALEFLQYEPMKLYMADQKKEVVELWANNAIARNFVNAGTPYKSYHVNRVGLFASFSKRNTYFQPKGEFWELFFSNHFGVTKIAS